MITRNKIDKAVRLYRAGKVTHIKGDLFQVSSMHQDETYRTFVNEVYASCSCEFGRQQGAGWRNPCSHMLAAAGAADIDVPMGDS
jgi:hypothetical protein